MSGYLYVLTSDAVPGWVKIGRTGREPLDRARELSTGVPGVLTVARAWACRSPRAAESAAHAALKPYRHESGDEWFEIAPDDAVRLIEGHVWKRDRPRLPRLRWAFLALALAALGLELYGRYGMLS